ncbi:MAG: HlyD family efflux transporter periplasmic adaptor subunit [Planctomycetota bacterium]
MKMLRYFVILTLLGLPACTRQAEDKAPGEHSDALAGEAAPATNRVDAPESVRRNLGITFATVESRPVAQTIRVPGQFELQPEARREYRTMLDGRVELLVKQFDSVEPGRLLYRLVSPQWRDLQEKLAEAESTIRRTEGRVGSIPTLIAAHRRHEEILEGNIALWDKRVEQLEQTQGSGVVSANELTAAHNMVATQRAELAEILEKEAELEGQIVAAQAEHDAAHARFRLLIATASSLLGIDDTALAAPYDLDEHRYTGLHRHEEPPTRPVAAWQRIDEVEIRASLAGVIESVPLTNGAWASTGALVLTCVDPNRLRFRAMGMQSDLGRLKSGLPARIVPPKGGSIDLQDTMEATLTLGLSADAQERTVELIAVPARLASWARPGVSAHLEIITAGGQNELAIPLSSVIQDGLSKVFFRRDPKDADKVIRTEADLGVNDGRWVAVQSGVRDGDEVVLDGVYQLMIATSGTVQKGGHFHGDGAFHEGKDK